MILAHVEVEKNTRSVTASMPNFGNMKNLITSLILLICAGTAFAQDGKIDVIGGAELDLLVDKKVNKVDTTDLWGYRIQIYFGKDRGNAQKVAQKLKSKYPELASEVYSKYMQPSWRVRVGNFYRKIDAQKLLHELNKDFEGVFLVRDVIKLPALKH
jgi:hypothetical protein